MPRTISTHLFFTNFPHLYTSTLLQELDDAARRRLPKQLYISLPCGLARKEMVRGRYSRMWGTVTTSEEGDGEGSVLADVGRRHHLRGRRW